MIIPHPVSKVCWTNNSTSFIPSSHLRLWWCRPRPRKWNSGSFNCFWHSIFHVVNICQVFVITCNIIFIIIHQPIFVYGFQLIKYMIWKDSQLYMVVTYLYIVGTESVKSNSIKILATILAPLVLTHSWKRWRKTLIESLRLRASYMELIQLSIKRA